MNSTLEKEIEEALAEQLAALVEGRAVLHIPALKGLYRNEARGHFHFAPEFFIQLQGTCTFTCPEESFQLNPGEFCLIPSGLPHYEEAPRRRSPFRNVVGLNRGDNGGFHLHMAKSNTEGMPKIQGGTGRSDPQAGRIFDYLRDAAEIYHSQREAREASVRGLLIAALGSMLTKLRRTESTSEQPLSNKIQLCQFIIRESLGSPTLSVKELAKELRCSADYLSHLFHREVGTPLNTYINHERVLQARQLLQTTPMNVSETAKACGYRDPSYFTRIFKRLTSQTPKQYQQRTRRS
ncbi:MAG: helix-turn-helix transcriptional regulator [Planctomycetota bacterium]|jgi:AraC-like DNA-binding protein